jgi:hypothetical protein
VTFTDAAPNEGAIAVSDVALLYSTCVAGEPPKLTVEPAVKLVPVIITADPPVAGPIAGETPVTVGVCPLAATLIVNTTHSATKLRLALGCGRDIMHRQTPAEAEKTWESKCSMDQTSPCWEAIRARW